MNRQDDFLDGRRILVTGACGTIGREIVAQLAADRYGAPAEILCIDNNESALFFEDQAYLADERVVYTLADVRDRRTLEHLFEGIDVVFHVAALKHVVLTERAPGEAVRTNINGVQNVIDAAERHGVGTIIFTSSDKAVNPTNVMGTSKLMGERLITAANSGGRRGRSVFASTRFGNVLGSSGSVLPIFRQQIARGGPVTITDERMTRFVMSVEASVALVVESARVARGGEVFVTKMPVVRIVDLAQAMIGLFAPAYGFDPHGIELKIIGAKPGEKLYEELLSDEETRRTLELEHFFAVLPAFRGVYRDIGYDHDAIVSDRVTDPYVSTDQPALDVAGIAALLRRHGLAGEPAEETVSGQWPGRGGSSPSDR